MQSAVPVGQGGMTAALGLNPEQAEQLCAHASKATGAALSPANFNCPGQIVLSGSNTALQWLRSEFKAVDLWPESPPRLKLIPLQVSAPFHCALMAPAEKQMRAVLGTMKFSDSSCPIIQNFTAQFEYQAEKLRENLIRQVCAPVRWMQSIKEAQRQGLVQFIECGPGRVLQGLVKKIDPQLQVFTTDNLTEIKALEATMKAVL